MPMKKLLARVKKYVRAQKRPRVKMMIGASAIALVLMTMVGAAMHMAGNRDPLKPVADPHAMGAKSAIAAPDPAAASGDIAITVRPAAPRPAPVTITGCLERHDAAFRLKDTAGADAPKSRSWKSGFLKKSSSSIDVVDGANRLKLKDHVGQRVSVTGVLVEREMQARSLKNVASSCGN
jgi:hypothetical protein